MRKIGEIRICSLWRKFVEMFCLLKNHLARRSTRINDLNGGGHCHRLSNAGFLRVSLITSGTTLQPVRTSDALLSIIAIAITLLQEELSAKWAIFPDLSPRPKTYTNHT